MYREIFVFVSVYASLLLITFLLAYLAPELGISKQIIIYRSAFEGLWYTAALISAFFVSGSRLFFMFDPPDQKHKVFGDINLKVIAVIFGLAGVCVVLVFLMSVSYYTGKPLSTTPWRFLIKTIAYTWLAYFLLSEVYQKFIRRSVVQLAKAYIVLSPADKSVIYAATQHNSSVVMTIRGSDNDRFCQQLSKLRWAVRGHKDMEQKYAQMNVDSVVWSLTDAGRHAVSGEVFRAVAFFLKLDAMHRSA